MEASFGYFQKVKPNSLILNPNLIDCYSSGLIAATLTKYSQHLLQGRTCGLSLYCMMPLLSRDEQILMRNGWHYELWPAPRSFHLQCPLNYDEKGVFFFFTADWLSFCCAEVCCCWVCTDVWSLILEQTSSWVGGREDWEHQKFLSVYLAELGRSTQSRKQTPPYPGAVVLTFSATALRSPPFPLSLAPYCGTEMDWVLHFCVPSCWEGGVRKQSFSNQATAF